jgi:hypothetical protein
MKYRIPEPGMTISSFADDLKKKDVTVNTHIFLFGLKNPGKENFFLNGRKIVLGWTTTKTSN